MARNITLLDLLVRRRAPGRSAARPGRGASREI